MIQRTWGERFRLNRRHLKIRSVRLSDSGVIVCKGVNGFGSQSVALDLVVRGRRGNLDRMFLLSLLFLGDLVKLIKPTTFYCAIFFAKCPKLHYNPLIMKDINDP